MPRTSATPSWNATRSVESPRSKLAASVVSPAAIAASRRRATAALRIRRDFTLVLNHIKGRQQKGALQYPHEDLILGAGQTGGTLAAHLASDAFDITLVDNNDQLLKGLKDRLDIQTVHGHASRPDTLLAAGADDADLLIAVTNSDEVNMVACQVCYSLFQTPTKIARIRTNEYFTGPNGDDAAVEFFSGEHMPIDVLINPERVVMSQIKELLEHPGALQVLDFADGRVQIAACAPNHGGPLVGQALRSLREHIRASTQGGGHLPPGSAHHSHRRDGGAGGRRGVLHRTSRAHQHGDVGAAGSRPRPNKRVMIAGGGNVGLMLARAIEDDFGVKVLEFGATRAALVAERLNHAVAIQGDATDHDLLVDENVEETDVFCAVTNDDEVNFMSALLAKRLGARQVIALIAKPAYVDLVQGREIDVAVSPQLSTTSSILSYVRRGDVTKVHRLRRGAAEAMETVVHGDARNSKVADRRIDEIPLAARRHHRRDRAQRRSDRRQRPGGSGEAATMDSCS